MQNLKPDEERIHDAFSKIKVDTEQLERSLKYMDKPKRIRRRLQIAIAAVLAFVMISATAYASVGGLDGFIARFNPEFGAFALPLLEPAYAVDQGIKIEVVGARVFENIMLLYVTMEDLTGENRLARDIRPDFMVYSDGVSISRGGGGSAPLHFDIENNRSYLEIRLTLDAPVGPYNALKIHAEVLNCFQHSGQVGRAAEGNWEMEIVIDHAESKTLVWTDICVGDFHIKYMSLGVMGLKIIGTCDWDWDEAPYGNDGRSNFISVTIEVDNRIRNIRFRSTGGGQNPAGYFEVFFNAASPIDMDAVTGVIVEGVRIPMP